MRHYPREVPAAQTWPLRRVLVIMAAITCALSLLTAMAQAPLLEQIRALKEQLALSQSLPDPHWKMVGWYRGEDSWPTVASGGSQVDVRLPGNKLPWREAGPPNHHVDKVGSDQEVVNKELSPSQAGQDRTVLDILGGKRGGFFVDLAANDASHISNSVMLEQVQGPGLEQV